MRTITVSSGELVYEHDGLLWKPLEHCTSTFEEFVEAGERFLEIFHETGWNPWRREELQAESSRVNRLRQEWARAEPDHRMMTDDEVDAWMAELDRESDARLAADEARWAKNIQRYSPERESSRYQLLEREAMRARLSRELDAYRSGTQFPSMTADSRAKKLLELELDHERNEAAIAELSALVGDPEEVVDKRGMAPRDRRPLRLVGYSVERQFRVEDLQASVATQRERLAATKDRKEKSALERSLSTTERRMVALIEVPRLTADDMCADCDTPMYQHLSGDGHECRPCPYWPMYAARMERVWANLRLTMGRLTPSEPDPPKPQPLATLAGNLPIDEVIVRLSDLQKQHPAAVVKRGRANRWELWSPDA